MADQLTSDTNASATPGGQSQTSGTDAPQNTTPQANGSEKIDLFKSEEFRGYQAQMNRTVTALQQELAQLRAQQAEAAMAGLDDFGKAQFLLQQKEQEISGYRQAMQQIEIEKQRQNDLAELSELTGAPVKAIANAQTYDEAVKLSIKWMKENGASAKEIAEAKREANAVDLGGGGAVTPQDRDTRERTELLKSGDTRTLFMKLLGE